MVSVSILNLSEGLTNNLIDRGNGAQLSHSCAYANNMDRRTDGKTFAPGFSLKLNYASLEADELESDWRYFTNTSAATCSRHNDSKQHKKFHIEHRDDIGLHVKPVAQSEIKLK